MSKKSSYKSLIITLLIIVAFVYGIILLAKASLPKTEDMSVAYENQGNQHIAEGSTHGLYNSNPPSSGWHYARWIDGGVYKDAVVDENVVHNLEHGDIWISYKPDVSEDVIKVLEKFGGKYLIVSPRDANDKDIALVSWGRVDAFDVVDMESLKERVGDFIKRHDNKGPEKVRNVAR